VSTYSAPDYLLRIQPYHPGEPVELLRRRLGVDQIFQLASNENTAGPPPSALAAARQALSQGQFYPDGGGLLLRQRLADRFGVEPQQVVLGNGSGELVDLLCKAFVADGGAVVVSRLAFVQYRLSAMAVNAELVEVEPRSGGLRDDAEGLAAAARGARLVFLANPNNPTGTYVTRRELDAYFETVGDSVLTVVDQAYQEYVDEPDYPNGLDDLKRGRNVVVLGTFSKLYGLAGLRIGYGLGPAELLAQLERARLPFNTNSVGQAAALAALDDIEHLEATRRRNRLERSFLAAELTRRGLAVTPSIANFLLVELARPAAEVVPALLRHGVWVRGLAPYGLPQAVRVTVGTRRENEAFLAALDAVEVAR
jgi:histidinol-phosphate aminotransferase